MKFKPIFVLACSGRTGSTLVQRVLNTSPGALIWGETRGMVLFQKNALDNSLMLQKKPALQEHRKRLFERNPTISSCLAVPDNKRVIRAIQSYLYDLYHFENCRWGFKEIHKSAELLNFLYPIFPEAQFILLVRKGLDIYRSMKGAKWKVPLDTFCIEYNKTLSLFKEYSKKNNIRYLRYEEFSKKEAIKLFNWLKLEIREKEIERAFGKRTMSFSSELTEKERIMLLKLQKP